MWCVARLTCLVILIHRLVTEIFANLGENTRCHGSKVIAYTYGQITKIDYEF